MDISISSGHLELDHAVREAAGEKIPRLCRYLEGMDRAEVRFREERNPRISEKEVCEVTMVGHGHVVRAKAAAPEQMAALDLVMDKLARRLERLKGRVVGRTHPHHRAPHNGLVSGAVIDEAVPELGSEPVSVRDLVVRTKQFAIKPMRAEEAALQMELLSHSFFLFTNADTGRAAVVYRRDDGDIGLIDAN